MMNFIFYKDAIHRIIRGWLKKRPKMNYLQRVWRHRNDMNFVSQVMNIKHPGIIEFKRFGEENPDKNIYFINVDGNRDMGFGGYLKETILALVEAEHLGFIPVISYKPENCLYAERESVNGTENPFEYYFEQVSDISVKDVYKSARVFLYNRGHAVRAEYDLGNPDPHASAGYFVDDEYLNGMARIFEKYIRLNPIVRDKIFEDMERLLSVRWEGKKILGVHIRGTDYALNWANHPNMVTVDEFMEAIDEVVVKHGYQYIFLATDDKRRLGALENKYGSRLLYYKDVARGDRELNIAMEKNSRSMHHYLNGLEVVRDMYTLASCDSLVCGLSQVATLARTIRLAGKESYRCLRILDKGIYQG